MEMAWRTAPADQGQPHRRRFVDTSLLGDDLEARWDQFRATLPIGRVV
jgi:hypothetical protein